MCEGEPITTAVKTDDSTAKVIDTMQIILIVTADRTMGVVKEEDKGVVKGVVKEEDKAMRGQIYVHENQFRSSY